jgi:hypothetical protein
MRLRFGLFLLLCTVSLLAVIFAALRAFGSMGLVPLIFSGLAIWIVTVVFRADREFDRAVLTFAAVAFALCAIVTFGLLVVP